MESPRLGVESELQVPAYTTATATWNPSRVCELHHSSRNVARSLTLWVRPGMEPWNHRNLLFFFFFFFFFFYHLLTNQNGKKEEEIRRVFILVGENYVTDEWDAISLEVITTWSAIILVQNLQKAFWSCLMGSQSLSLFCVFLFLSDEQRGKQYRKGGRGSLDTGNISLWNGMLSLSSSSLWCLFGWATRQWARRVSLEVQCGAPNLKRFPVGGWVQATMCMKLYDER